MSTSTPFPSDRAGFTVFFSNLSDDQVFLTFVLMVIFGLLMATMIIVIQKHKPSLAVQTTVLPAPRSRVGNKKKPSKAKALAPSLTKNQIRIM